MAGATLQEPVALPQLSRSVNEIQSWAVEICLAPRKGRGNWEDVILEGEDAVSEAEVNSNK